MKRTLVTLLVVVSMLTAGTTTAAAYSDGGGHDDEGAGGGGGGNPTLLSLGDGPTMLDYIRPGDGSGGTCSISPADYTSPPGAC